MSNFELLNRYTKLYYEEKNSCDIKYENLSTEEKQIAAIDLYNDLARELHDFLKLTIIHEKLITFETPKDEAEAILAIMAKKAIASTHTLGRPSAHGGNNDDEINYLYPGRIWAAQKKDSRNE